MYCSTLSSSLFNNFNLKANENIEDLLLSESIMMELQEALVMEFDASLNRLRDWPEKAIIFDLTKFAETNVDRLAPQVTDIIASRLMDPRTNLTYKLPMFYLIDSIMKHVGGPYAALFSRYLGDLFIIAFEEVAEKDRGRLDFLLGTWEERKLLLPDLLMKMRQAVIAKAAGQRTLSGPQSQSSSIPRKRRWDDSQVMPHSNTAPPDYVQQQQQQQEPVDHYPSQGDGLPPAIMQPPYSSPLVHQQQGADFPTYDDIVAIEMEKVLIMMYNEMGIVSQIPLADIAIMNPNLYSQVRLEASVQANDVVMGLKNGSVTIDDLLGPGPTIHHRHTGGGVGVRDRGERDVEEQRYREPRRGGGGGGRSRDREWGPPGSGTARHVQGGRAAEWDSRAGRQGGHYTTSSDYPAPVHSRAEAVATAMGGGTAAMLLDQQFVNAFVCESPVVLDIERLKSLMNKLQSYPSSLPATIGIVSSIKSGDVDAAAAADDPLVRGVKEVAELVASKLQNLLETVHIPPQLPSILFGPLPLEPSKDFLHRMETSSVALATDVLAPPPVIRMQQKLLTPRFRVDLLNQNPQHALAGLYADRPLQNSEDGVRFKTLAELSRHTEANVARREVQRKRDAAGEKLSRGWYCTLPQWVTNFRAAGATGARGAVLGLSGAPGTEGSSGSWTGPAGDEIFIVPADEFFTRCPVSKEVFETLWDDDEGEYMFRNAVKVLVTEAADASLFRLGQPTGRVGVHYLIVHKPLVLDGWLATGRADSLTRAKLRYDKTPGGADKIAALDAAADGEADDDVFVMLEL